MNDQAQNQAALRVPTAPKQVKVLDITLIDDYRSNAHVLVPQSKLVPISPHFQVRLERVNVSPIAEDRDIYQLPGSYDNPKFALSANALYRLANAAGIQRMGCQFMGATQSYVMAQAKVRRRDTSGEYVWEYATYELDLEIIEADQFDDYVGKMKWAAENPRHPKAKYAPKSENECREKARTYAMKIRRHKTSRAETGAYCRAIRAMLGIENGYTLEALHLPFLVSVTSFAPDLQDPEMKKAASDAGRLTIAQLWGGSSDVAAVEASAGKTAAEIRAAASRRYDAINVGAEEPESPAEPTFTPDDFDLDDAHWGFPGVDSDLS